MKYIFISVQSYRARLELTVTEVYISKVKRDQCTEDAAYVSKGYEEVLGPLRLLEHD